MYIAGTTRFGSLGTMRAWSSGQVWLVVALPQLSMAWQLMSDAW